jgi:hypothetical protein
VTDLRGMNASVEDYCHTADELDAAEFTAHEDGKKVGAATERASIVAWLRLHPSLSAIFREHIAVQIERGEHAQPESARRR